MRPFAGCIVCLLLLNISSVFAADGYQRVAGIDIIHYRIGLTLDPMDSVITGETGILVSFTGTGITEIPLDFGALTVDRVLEQDVEAAYKHEGERLTVTLKGTYKSGDRTQLTIFYHGQPKDGLFIQNNKFGNRAIFADNFSNRAHHWFPSIDHPYDKATVRFEVTAPEGYDVVANGRLIETTHLQDGLKRTIWQSTTEIPTYCMVVGATNFSIVHAGSWNGIPVSYYLYPEDRENGITDFSRALQMLELYSTMIGPYPYAKLALVQSSTRYGGMENASAIFFSERSIRGTKQNEGTIAHEIAHQWFGDSVTESDWHHVWLSEGFATYFGALYFERAYGRDRFIQSMQGSKQRYLRAFERNPGPIHDSRITDLSDVLTGYHYVKGGWVLHMLRGIMGDTAFFNGIRDYYRTYRDENALTGDLQKVMEFHAERPLDWFFQQWIYETGHPVYQLTWTWDDPKKQVAVRIRQAQEGVTYRMPLMLSLQSAGNTTRETIQSTERDQTFTIGLDGKPTKIILDPDEWVLKEMMN